VRTWTPGIVSGDGTGNLLRRWARSYNRTVKPASAAREARVAGTSRERHCGVTAGRYARPACRRSFST
jgi:hypothetical protein